MTSASRTTLFEYLQKEFSPTLDSSLIAVLLVEIESDVEGKVVTPTQEQINTLRTTLGELSSQAEESRESEFSESPFTFHFDETISSLATSDIHHEASSCKEGSGSSTSSSRSFNSPLGFLQAAMPEISASRLRVALEDAEKNNLDMWDMVAGLLTDESIREMEERGIDGLEDGGGNFDIQEDDWETVESRSKKKKSQSVIKKRTQPRPKAMALVDIRQQHHVRSYHHSKNNSLDSKTPLPDPWTQIASLADHLSSLLPPNPPSIFQSFFHSPSHPSTYDALRAALTSLCKSSTTDLSVHKTVLYNLLDVVMPEYEDSDAEQRSRLISDVQLAVTVTNGQGDESLDLIKLLRELDSNTEFGIYHLRPPESAKGSNTVPPIANRLPLGPPPIQLPQNAKFKQKSSASVPRAKPSPYQWQVVPERKPYSREIHPLVHIPGYARNFNDMKNLKTTSDSSDFRRRRNQLMRKRNEALREATRMWQKGTAKSHGGEVALYFAERARELHEVAKKEALNAARVIVHEKRITTQKYDTIDLHGTTIAEAIVIVREILREESSSISQAKPMKIITGRGTHSLNQVSILKPALRKALAGDGWVVGSWDGGLIVRGRI